MKHYIVRFLYKIFRKLKGRFIAHPSFWGTCFFKLLTYIEPLLSGRRLTKNEIIARSLWKSSYFARYGTQSLFTLHTKRPIAASSDDHIYPRGTIQDNSTNYNFNLKLYEFFRFKNELKVLDLGCSGGGFIKQLIEDGHIGVGIEGSDVSRRFRSGEWDTIPHHLFTADITEPFTLYSINLGGGVLKI